MRTIALLVFALALSGTFSTANAQSSGAMNGSGGPIRSGDMCRSFNGNNNNLIFSYWATCPGTEQGGTRQRVAGTTNEPGGTSALAAARAERHQLGISRHRVR
jgi:hypothetical protein